MPGGKGKGPPPGKGKGKATEGKGKGPGPPKAKAPPLPKGKGKAGASGLSPRGEEPDAGVAESPFGKRIHWVQPTYCEPGGDTIFAKLGSGSEGPQIDQKFLSAVFSGDSPAARGQRKSFLMPKPMGKCLLDTQRAQSAAIMIKRLKVSTEEVRRCVNELDFEGCWLKADDMEMISNVMPTPDEAAMLLKYKEEVEQLRDVEQKLMPLCQLSTSKLRVMKLGISHTALYASMSHRCGVIMAAAEEAKRSTQFMEFLRLALQVGNFINHGEAEMREGMCRAFALESLQMLSSCKAGPVSALHFVCITLRSEDLSFMRSLLASLSQTRAAAREKTSVLEADIANFSKETQFLKQAAQRLPPEEGCRDRLEKLTAAVEQEDTNLRAELQGALKAVSDAQAYFGVSVKQGARPPTSDQFFGQIVTTLDTLGTAWREVESHERRWRRQYDASGAEQKDEAEDRPPPSPRGGKGSGRPRINSAGAAVRDASSTPPSTPSGPKARKSCPSVPLGVRASSATGQPRRSSSSTGSAKPGGAQPPSPTREQQQQRQQLRVPRIPRIAEALNQEYSPRRYSPRGPPAAQEALMAPRGHLSTPSGTSSRTPSKQRAEASVEQRREDGLCEFHAIHDSDCTDTDEEESVAALPGMNRSRSSFPDICAFEPCPVDPNGNGEQHARTWDFEISAVSAFTMALWRRQREEGKLEMFMARQKTM